MGDGHVRLAIAVPGDVTVAEADSVGDGHVSMAAEPLSGDPSPPKGVPPKVDDPYDMADLRYSPRAPVADGMTLVWKSSSCNTDRA